MLSCLPKFSFGRFLILCLCLPAALAAAPDAAVSVVVTGDSNASVPVGTEFGVTVVVSNTGPDPFLTGENLTHSLRILGQGTEIFTAGDNIVDGLDPGASRTFEYTFNLDYSQAAKFNAGWSAMAVITAARDTNTGNNQHVAAFRITVPDLQIANLRGPANALPGEDFSVNFQVLNSPLTGTAGTDPTVLVSAEAILFNPGGNEVDRESALVNSRARGISAGATLQTAIDRLRIPADASPGDQYSVQVTVDPGEPDLIVETDETNHIQTVNVTVGGAAAINLLSFEHDDGTFFSGDPVHMRLKYQNTGTAAVPVNQVNNIRIVLSRDNSNIGADDFILRTINASGNNHGTPLHSGETVSMDWVQTLPGNFNGTFFVLAELNGTIMPADHSPSLSIFSSTNGETSLLSNNTTTLSDSPDVSADGKSTVYESIIGGTSQIFLRRENNAPVQVTNGNAGSYSPSISADGGYVVFYSYASDLVVGDNNGLADVYLFDAILNRTSRISVSTDGGDSNGGSFTPVVDSNGSRIAFESFSDNLGSDPNPQASDIFIYDVHQERMRAITIPKASSTGATGSFQPDISDDGKRVVYSSYSSGLIDADTNGYADVFLWDEDKNTTFRLSRTADAYAEASGGHSIEAAISGDGKFAAFSSRGRNMVTGKGIVSATVDVSGAGYTIPPTITITDELGPGFGAIAEAVTNNNGEIVSITVTNPGSGYMQPKVVISQNPLDNAVLAREAKATANLSHELGDVYLVNLDKIIRFDEGNRTDVGNAVLRVSEAANGVGGNSFSRQPTLSYDGSLVAYRTQASNLLDGNLTRTDGKTFFNNQSRRAVPSIILGGGLTEIEVADGGVGYEDGFLRIVDDSGSGSGAIASYRVDGAGRIVAVDVLNSGTGYRPTDTKISVDNPRAGQGFLAGTIRHSGAVLQVELTDSGFGYPKTSENLLPKDFVLTIDGDGQNALMDMDLVRVGDSGELLLLQKATLSLVSLNGLQGETLTVSDRRQSLTITFDQNTPTIGWDSATKRIGFSITPPTSPSTMLSSIESAIRQTWATDASSTAMDGVLASSNGAQLQFEAISGRFSSSNPNALSVVVGSNLLTQGTGYEFGTAVVGPDPVIYGFSEIAEDFSRDNISSDIYMFHVGDENGTGKKNERVSISSFGYPVRSFGEPTSPSSRHPTMSADGRYVVFSSDAEGLGGLVFGANNQSAGDNNGFRDIHFHDRKVSLTLPPDHITNTTNTAGASGNVTMLYPPRSGTHAYAPGSNVPVIVDVNMTRGNVGRVVLIVDGVPHNPNLAEFGPFATGRFTGDWTATTAGVHTFAAIAFDDNNLVIGESQPVEIQVKVFQGSSPPTVQLMPIAQTNVSSKSTLAIQATGSDPDGDFKSMEFYVDGYFHAKVDRSFVRSVSAAGVVTSAYTAEWDVSTPGIHTYFVVGHDNSGNYVTTSGQTIFATTGEGSAPTVSLFEIPKEISLGETLRFVADANDTDGNVTQVEFFVDGVSLGVDAIPSFAADWNVPNWPNAVGVHEVFAAARDDVGNFGLSEIKQISVGRGSPPTISLVAPSLDIKVSEGGPVHFVAEVRHADRGVQNVRLLIDSKVVADANASRTTLNRYSMTWDNATEGNHTVQIEALDNFGNSLADQYGKIEVRPMESYFNMPSVLFKHPAGEVNGTTLTDTSETYLLSQVSDLDGNVSKLQFYVDGVPEGNATIFDKNSSYGTGRYTAWRKWSPPAVGSYTFYAVAEDGDGNVGMSETVTVNAVPGTGTPTVSLQDVNRTIVEPGKPIVIRSIRSGARQAQGNPIVPWGWFANNRIREIRRAAIIDPGAGYVSTPRIEFFGSGHGAEATAIVDLNRSSVRYGEVTGVNITAGGQGYSGSSTDMEFIGGHGAQQIFLEGTPGDADNTRELRLLDNGSTFSSSTIAPFGANKIFSLGRHQVFAEVVDQEGNWGVSDPVTIDIRPFSGIRPTVEVSYPPIRDIGNRSFFPLIARAFDGDSPGGAPSSVYFYLNNEKLGEASRIAQSHFYKLDFNASKYDWGDYTIRAVAKDSSDNHVVSTPVDIRIIAQVSEAPTVNWIAPDATKPIAGVRNPRTFALGSQISLVAMGRRLGSPIRDMTFMDNGAVIGTSNAPSLSIGAQSAYSSNWTPVLAGVHDLWAIVDAEDTLISTSVRTFNIIDTNGSQLPTVQIAHPATGDSFTSKSTVRLYATSSSPDGSLEGVQFYVNGANAWIQLLSNPLTGDEISLNDGFSSAVFTFGQNGLNRGSVRKESRDNLLKQINEEIESKALKVSAGVIDDHTILLNFENTTDGKLTASGSGNLMVQLLPESTRQQPIFQNNNSYFADWVPGFAGSYIIHAVARDFDSPDDYGGNKVMSAPVTVTATVGKANLPKITLAALNDVHLINDALFLSATVEDADNPGTTVGIQNVRFLVNGSAVGAVDSLPPYFATWTPTQPGLYEIAAYTRDDDGNIAFSNVETVVVVAETSELLAFSSVDRTLPGQAQKVVTITKTRNSRRSAVWNASSASIESTGKTNIKGISTNFLTQLVPGQKIKFGQLDPNTGVNVTTEHEYTVTKIVSDSELELAEDLSDDPGNPYYNDYIFLTQLSSVQVVEVYRAGSSIYLAADQSGTTTDVARINFYVDGVQVAADTTWPFSTRFIPGSKGEYAIRAVSTTQNGIEKLVDKYITVHDQNGSLPDGSRALYPSLTRRGSTSRGSKLIAAPRLVDLDDGINRVEFYLNGKFYHVDNDAPFYSIFSPDSSTSLAETDRDWELMMVAVDNGNNRITLMETGTVSGSVQLPTAVVTHPAPGSEFSAGQVLEITVEVRGFNLNKLVGPNAAGGNNANAGLSARQMALFANGEEIGTANETTFGSGRFEFEWSTKNEVAGSDGKVDIFGAIVMEDETNNGLTFTPSIVSEPVTVTITERNPLGDVKSAIGQFYNDLLFYEPAEQEVNLTLTKTGHGTLGQYVYEDQKLLDWAAGLSQKQAFQNLVDAVAGYHITIGEWPPQNEMVDALQTYSAIPNYGRDGSGDNDGDGYSLNQETLFGTNDNNATIFPDNAFRLGSYLDRTLSSPDFYRRHDKIPPLDGSDRTENYEENRRNFVKLLYKNKYGVEPNLQQQVQGSYRLRVFDPNSQESKREEQQKMMQQMTMMGMFGGGMGGMGGMFGGGFGGGRPNNNNNNNNNNFFNQLLGGMFGNNNNNNNNNNGPNYKSGISAVLFTTYMVLEDQIENLDLLWGIPSRRADYQSAALMLALWQDNVKYLDHSEIKKFSGMSLASQLKAMMKDYRYRSRFVGMSISRDAEAHPTIPEWKYLPWLGYYNDRAFPWIYHQGLGWVYVRAANTADVWLYIPDIGWMWTKDSLWTNLPSYSSTSGETWTLSPFYDATAGGWTWYAVDSGRQFYDYDRVGLVDR